MKEYELELLKKEKVARGTTAFHLEKPNGFNFAPGQYMQVFTKDGDSHTFSIASAPYENEIIFATRMREESSFKNKLSKVNEGEKIKIQAPGGQFVLPEDASVPIVFLVGGIGITPIRSMVLHLTHEKSPQKIYLLYSNKTKDDSTWLEELSNIKNPNFIFTPVISDQEGKINIEKIKKYIKNLNNVIYYVVGPPGFVGGMSTILKNANVPRGRIESEDFSGY